ncbi:response regulator transcription factor [Marinoscillum pacificum]|uniref:response regulator transcription factor n=1 Tax=Marinoscillum pacificum TaxID=392723 RepID=UPI00215862DD|nr:response regulator transcription factor [Marinoscillum pacificum]
MASVKILLVEDDENLSFVVADHLSHEGFEVITAVNGEEGLQKFQLYDVNLCLIDVMMPKMDGFSLASEIRKRNEFVPILFLTARSMEEDRLKGFEVGGDDYIAKPFSIAELTHRINVFIRRSLVSTPSDSRKPSNVQIGSLEFDPFNLQINCGEKSTSLTQMEADLLKMLLSKKNKLVRREDILVAIWGENDYFKGRSLDVFISRLRKYLKDDPTLELRNHHGVGFSLIDGDFAG